MQVPVRGGQSGREGRVHSLCKGRSLHQSHQCDHLGRRRRKPRRLAAFLYRQRGRRQPLLRQRPHRQAGAVLVPLRAGHRAWHLLQAQRGERGLSIDGLFQDFPHPVRAQRRHDLSHLCRQILQGRRPRRRAARRAKGVERAAHIARPRRRVPRQRLLRRQFAGDHRQARLSRVAPRKRDLSVAHLRVVVQPPLRHRRLSQDRSSSRHRGQVPRIGREGGGEGHLRHLGRRVQPHRRGQPLLQQVRQIRLRRRLSVQGQQILRLVPLLRLA